MAEIASAYPTAGGLYYWASKLGSPGWGWATGWFNLIGQIAVTAAIGYGLAIFAQVLFDDWFSYTKHMNDWFGMSFNAATYIVYAVFMLAAVIINLLNIRLTSGLNMISAWWHMIGVVLIVGILIVVPDHHQSLSYVFTETVNNSGYGGGTTSFANPAFWFVFGLGLLLAAVHDHGLRRVRAHGGGDATRRRDGAAVGMWTSVFVSVVFGFILLVAVTFAIPGTTEEALDQINNGRPGRPVDLDRVDGPALGGVPALHLRRRAVLLRHRVGDLGVADDVRLLARRRGARPSALAARRPEPRAEVVRARHRVHGRRAHGPGDLELLHRLRGRDRDRRHRPLHRVRHPRLPALAEGRQLGRAARLESRAGTTSGSTRSRSSGWRSSRSSSCSRSTRSGFPWNADFDWNFANYTVLWFAGFGIVFGGWWALSAKNWFKGPVRMGTEEELERLEQERLAEFGLPTEA